MDDQTLEARLAEWHAMPTDIRDPNAYYASPYPNPLDAKLEAFCGCTCRPTTVNGPGSPTSMLGTSLWPPSRSLQTGSTLAGARGMISTTYSVFHNG